jgi:hypothetical protein
VKVASACTDRAVAATLVLLLAFPFGGATCAAAQEVDQKAGAGGVSAAGGQVSASNSQGSSSSQANQSKQVDQQPLPAEDPQRSQAPVGTAAAPYEKSIGVAASRPAGAVIAPGKQRRTRSFVIKVGLLVGAAAAVGTVAALSSGSPSKPQ